MTVEDISLVKALWVTVYVYTAEYSCVRRGSDELSVCFVNCARCAVGSSIEPMR